MPLLSGGDRTKDSCFKKKTRKNLRAMGIMLGILSLSVCGNPDTMVLKFVEILSPDIHKRCKF